MILVKVLLLLAGSGTVAGVTYSQIQKDPTSKVVVANNHESKIRSSLEKQLDTNLLKHKQNFLTTKKKDKHNKCQWCKSFIKWGKTKLATGIYWIKYNQK